MPRALALRAEFDGYGCFFNVEAFDVEYAELENGLTLGDMIIVPVPELSRFSPKWGRLPARYSGMALLIRNADTAGFDSAQPEDLSVVIADRISFTSGSDWEPKGRRRLAP
jgi:hypothetical protein